MALHRAAAVIVLAFGGARTVHAEVTCASLACLQDLSWYANKCTIYNADGDACLQSYMTRTDGTFSPCEYSPDDPAQYKPNDDPPFDARCHSSRNVRLTCDPAPSATQCDPSAAPPPPPSDEPP